MNAKKLSAAQIAALQELDMKLALAQDNADIVSQGVNSLRVIIILEDTFGDGIQLVEDALKLIGAEPVVRSIIEKMAVFIDSLGKLDSELGSEVVLEIHDKAIAFTPNGKFGVVSVWFSNTFLMGGFTFEKVMEVKDIIDQLIGAGRLYGSKGDLAAHVRKYGVE